MNNFTEQPLRILIDMDQVIADFEGGFLRQYRLDYPNDPWIPLEERNTFYLTEQYSKAFSEDVAVKTRSIYNKQGFIRGLRPINGAVDAVKTISSLDNTVIFFCSSSLSRSPCSASEKNEWIMEHFGKRWADKLILTRDKTMIIGDILIDDKPTISGVNKPMWDHLIMSSCSNKHIDETKIGPPCIGRLHSWFDFERLLDILDDVRKRKLKRN